jgi:hypothetical protein
MKPILGLICLLCCLASGCSDRQHRNPLDPRATEADPAVAVVPLAAAAGSGQVQLWWDYRTFTDLSGYRLYRRAGDGAFSLYATLAPPDTAFTDRQVENGATYAYQLALLIDGEGERLLAPVRQGTPGPQAGWALDPGTGLAWRITPDNRAAFFARGRFAGLAGAGVDPRDGACWVSDEYYRGLVRISAEGEVSKYPGQVEQPGPLAIDPQTGEGWLIDLANQTVSWFAPPASGDSLRLETADARFSGLQVLEAAGGTCWIGAAGRVLRYWREGRRQEWAVSQPVALAPDQRGGAWALVRGGEGLVYLEPGGAIREVSLPLGPAAAIEVDTQSGLCWVGGSGGVVALDAQGGVVVRAEELNELTDCRGLALDSPRQQVWVATPGQLLKLSANGRLLARLGGFASLGGIEIDLGDYR